MKKLTVKPYDPSHHIEELNKLVEQMAKLATAISPKDANAMTAAIEAARGVFAHAVVRACDSGPAKKSHGPIPPVGKLESPLDWR